MKRMCILLGAAMLYSCNDAPKSEVKDKISYPSTKKVDLKDTFFGVDVPNPYGWLEDDKSSETSAWVKEQNSVTESYLSQIPYKNALKEELKNLWNFPKQGAPFSEGDYTYYYKNDGLQNQSVLYRKDKDGNESIFLDPNSFSKEGTTSLGSVSFTKDGSLVGYSISEGGSDWRKIIVLDAKTKEIVGDTLFDVKFSGISWKSNEGFYYSSYDKPQGSELSAKTDHHKLYYHQLGTKQSQDILVFGKDESQKYRYVSGYVTDDQNWLVVSVANATSGNNLFVKDLRQNSDFKQITFNFESDTSVIETQGDVFYLKTNLKSPNGKLVKVSSKDFSVKNWVDVIPETENVLSVSLAGNYLIAHYIQDAVSKVKQYDFSGKLIREITLPGVGSASGFSAKKQEKIAYYSFTNYATPAQIYAFDIEEGTSKLYYTPPINFNPENYTSEQVFYTSKDGTKVPMIITYKKGLKKDGQNPTILYGYGGFNASLTPTFSVANAVWLNQGGVYAVANLRGGGEYGKKWHDAGTKLQKQNVFDDFIAAAEYLIQNQFTTSEKLAIRGGSNGGLLVGATLTQRPDLMKVAIPEVGVLDMLRYHKFTAGAGWAYDYGTADDNPEMFNYLKNYSPLHNVKAGVCYPAVIVTTGDHDDRVVPAHSFKFAAELQEKQSCQNPTLIRIDINAGHGAGTPVSKIIDKTADIYAFTLWNMGYKKLK